MLYVHMDLYKANYRRRNRGETIEEKKLTLGPFKRVMRGYQGELHGIAEDDSVTELFEATVGHGGYCETCAYDYPDFAYTDRSDGSYASWEVKDFSIDDQAG